MSSTNRRLGFEPLEDRRFLTTITVNTTVDENNGTGNVSLREAVGMANTGDTINFSVTGTINLLGTAGFGQISIGKSLTIQGPGSNLLTVKAFDPDPGGTNNSNGSRVFAVEDNTSLLDVTISGLTLSNGDPVVLDENSGGGAILNRENLTLNSCVLSGNFSPNGGAIYNASGLLAINDCTISGNNAGDAGGVLMQGGSLSINRTTIADNQVTNAGGGILSRTVPVSIADSTISGNSAGEGGGGIYQDGGSLTVTGTTISNNTAGSNQDGFGGGGGGIYKLTGSLSITSSTVSGNSAAEGGGGIFSNSIQTITIAHSTITGNVIANTAGVYGGGINSAGSANLNHTIVAGNLRGASTRDDVSGTFNTTYSLIGDRRSANVTDVGGSLIGTTASPINPKLAPLANNGGLTLTHALQSGSPALEAGDPLAVANANGIPPFDQRGTPFSRVVDYDGVGGARIDIGAVEMAPTVPALLGDYNLNQAVDAADYVLWRKTQGGSVPLPYSGADGDGNTAINSNDYTVWRSRFGNPSGAASGVSFDETDQPSDGTAAAALEFAALATKNEVSDLSSGAIGRESPATAIDAAIELLVALDRSDTPLDDGGSADFAESPESPSLRWYSLIDQVECAVSDLVVACSNPQI